jgi:hypothetical protein
MNAKINIYTNKNLFLMYFLKINYINIVNNCFIS